MNDRFQVSSFRQVYHPCFRVRLVDHYPKKGDEAGKQRGNECDLQKKNLSCTHAETAKKVIITVPSGPFF